MVKSSTRRRVTFIVAGIVVLFAVTLGALQALGGTGQETVGSTPNTTSVQQPQPVFVGKTPSLAELETNKIFAWEGPCVDGVITRILTSDGKGYVLMTFNDKTGVIGGAELQLTSKGGVTSGEVVSSKVSELEKGQSVRLMKDGDKLYLYVGGSLTPTYVYQWHEGRFKC